MQIYGVTIISIFDKERGKFSTAVVSSNLETTYAEDALGVETAQKRKKRYVYMYYCKAYLKQDMKQKEYLSFFLVN